MINAASGSCDITWVSGSCPGGVDNSAGASTRTFYYPLPVWNSRYAPYAEYYLPVSHTWKHFTSPTIGHNGAHSLSLSSVDNDTTQHQLEFQRYNPEATPPGWQTPLVEGDVSKTITVNNLTITSLTPGNGTIDYIKYDPVPESPYNRPTMAARLQDHNLAQSANLYQCYWMLLSTASTAPREVLNMNDVYSVCDASLKSDAASPTVSFTWQGTLGDYDEDNPPTDAEYDMADRSTYTYDVDVMEYDDNNNFLDWFSYKFPSSVEIGDHFISATENADGSGSTLSYSYCVLDPANQNFIASQAAQPPVDPYYPNAQPPTNMQMILIDNDLTEQDALNLGWQNYGQNYGGIGQSQNDADAFNYWRTVYIGQDNSWIAERRDHQSSRMLAWNAIRFTDPKLMVYIEVNPDAIVDAGLAVLKKDVIQNIKDILQMITFDSEDSARIGIGTPYAEYWYTFTKQNKIKLTTCPEYKEHKPGIILSYYQPINTVTIKPILGSWVNPRINYRSRAFKSYNDDIYNSDAWVADALQSIQNGNIPAGSVNLFNNVQLNQLNS
jgi:hypothetical protein